MSPLILLLQGAIQAAEPATTEPATAEPATAAEEEVPWVALPDAARDFGSALAPLDEALRVPPAAPPAEASASITTAPSATLPEPERALARGRFGLRPRLAAAGFQDGPWGVALGGTVSHQWWMLSDRPVRPAGETHLDAVGRLGAVGGPDLRLTTSHGVWLGPVGLLAGGSLRYDRLSADDGSAPPLEAGLTLGPQPRVALRLGPLRPWASWTPAWVLAGPRTDLVGLDEQTWEGGLDVPLRAIDLRLSGELRDTPDTELWGLALGLRLHI
jgi:hypothetical protein